MQRSPLRYFERRIEHAELIDDLHYAMTVTQQFTVPFLDKQQRKDSRSTHLSVPLGWFAKDRLPDVEVRDESGATLPFLRRKDQGRIGAILFLGSWEQKFFANVSREDDEDAKKLWALIQTSIERVITRDRERSQLVIYLLRQFLREGSIDNDASPGMRCFLLVILAEHDFWMSFKTLAEVRLLFTWMKGRPGRTYVLTTKYTERFPQRPPPPRGLRGRARRAFRRGPKLTAQRVVWRTLAWLGVGSISMIREANNLGHAASFWTIFRMPEGIEQVRRFWRRTRSEALPEDIVSVDVTKAAIGKHHAHGQAVEPDLLCLDVQVEPSSAMLSAAGLAALLFLVGTFVYKAMPQLIHEKNLHEQLVHGRPVRGQLVGEAHTDYLTGLVGIGTILAATPAAIAGALAYRGHTFVRRASRGPRTMLALLSAQAAVLAVAMGLQGPGEFSEYLAFALSIYSLTIAGDFLVIRVGPRWRKNEHSRRKGVTERASPSQCRRRQVQYALVCLLPWLVVVLVVARGQSVLQHEHVFGAHFPGNVWDAWWSWFGI